MRVVLISTYELGHQPFGLASPAAWLRAAGMDVICQDLAIHALDEAAIATADLVALYLPMHTATRIVARLLPRLRRLNPQAHLCCYGLYAPLNAAYLRRLGAASIIGGEFERRLTALATQLAEGATPAPVVEVDLARQQFQLPDRSGLPGLDRYAHLTLSNGDQRIAGYTEASRGCKHLCRHCPIPSVYGGQFRVVQRDVVLEDIARQVAAGAQHITFGDPDFFNGPGHAVPLLQALHARFPTLTYDVTIKVEHLLKHARHLPALRTTGCLFITTAVEAFDDRILHQLAKGHSRADFVQVVEFCREIGLTLNPTFVAFTPWTTLAGYREFLATIADLDLIENIAPIQYALRLLIPADSLLLELPEIQALVEPFDAAGLCYPWRHPDPQVDALQARVIALVEQLANAQQSRRATFAAVWELAHSFVAVPAPPPPALEHRIARSPIPYMSEPWYC